MSWSPCLIGGSRSAFRHAHRGAFLAQAAASQTEPRVSGRAERDPVEPVRKQVGIANRSRLSGEDQENRLERVFGVMFVNQKLAA
jgi:hypothetical protein